MEYAKIGNTDIEVSKLCVGCMSFGKAGTMHDWTVDKSETEKIVKHALDLGINFFDTANRSRYSFGMGANNDAGLTSCVLLILDFIII